MCREAFGKPFSVEEKTALYKRAGGVCEHPEGCRQRNPTALTIDHFTPQCLGKLLGWTLEQIDDPANLLLLCRYHHIRKDSITEQELANVKFLEKPGHALSRGRQRFYVKP